MRLSKDITCASILRIAFPASSTWFVLDFLQPMRVPRSQKKKKRTVQRRLRKKQKQIRLLSR